ncbi:MAG: hypothetical protein LC776_01195 [Acidobacteria bacterium]|nr:hypothetical protein [Acidobacteriota bacterium]
MRRFLPIFILLSVSFTNLAQTSRQPRVRYGGSQRTAHIIEMLRMANDETANNDLCHEGGSTAGTIMKLEYADDELRITGFVLRGQDGKREYMNLDSEYLYGNLSMVDLSHFQGFINVGKRVNVEFYQ